MSVPQDPRSLNQKKDIKRKREGEAGRYVRKSSLDAADGKKRRKCLSGGHTRGHRNKREVTDVQRIKRKIEEANRSQEIEKKQHSAGRLRC